MVLLNVFAVVIASTTISTFGHSDGIRSERSVSFVPQVPEECIKAGICENIPDYPYEHVDALLAKLSDDDKARFNFLEETPNSWRIAGSPDDMELCRSVKRTIYPNAAKTSDDIWAYVINMKKEKQQGYVVEQCTNPGATCDTLVSFPPNYLASCKQKFISTVAWTLGTDGEMHKSQILLPSCCSCIVNPKYSR